MGREILPTRHKKECQRKCDQLAMTDDLNCETSRASCAGTNADYLVDKIGCQAWMTVWDGER